MLAAAAAVAMLVAGCSTLYEGRYDFYDGWREGRVTDVADGRRLVRGATSDCRNKTAWRESDHFARVEYRFSARMKLTYITRMSGEGAFGVGDNVYVNIRRCDASLAPRGTPAARRLRG